MIQFTFKRFLTMLPAPIRYLCKATTLLPMLVARAVVATLPRDTKSICAGAWCGNLYSDNPKYLVEYLLGNSDFRITWIGHPQVERCLPKHPNLRFVRKNSLKAALTLLRAKFWICCTGRGNDLTDLPLDGGAVIINPWHGIPIKNLGQNTIWDIDSRTGKGLRAALERLYALTLSHPREWVTISSPLMKPIMMNGFRTICTPKKFLIYGSPRIDFLVKGNQDKNLQARLKEKYAKLLGFDASTKIVLYAPTWRIKNECPFCFYNLPAEEANQVAAILKASGAVLIEKHHTHTLERFTPDGANSCSLPISAAVEKSVDTQELLLIADILITDYSSIYLDYTCLKRPIIHFTYDIGIYSQDDMGLAYKLEDVCGGPIVSTLDELLPVLKRNLDNPLFAPGPLEESLCEYETGKACEQLLSFMRSF